MHESPGSRRRHPKPESRTLSAARALAARIGEPSLTIDLAAHEIGAFGSLAEEFAAYDILVVASPTYRGTYTGLLKLFLDQLPYKALAGRTGPRTGGRPLPAAGAA